jgi:DNA repair exonuclease SbcCD ATPase subunit
MKSQHLGINIGDISRLEDIQQQMLELLDEARTIIRSASCRNQARERAEAYWIPQVKVGLTKEHDYLGGCMCTMSDTIEALREEFEDESAPCEVCGLHYCDGNHDYITKQDEDGE